MFVEEIHTTDPDIKLIKPDPNKHAALSLEWLHGDAGRETLRLMGVSSKLNTDSGMAEEKARMEEFLDDQKEINWMISYCDRVVGALWFGVDSTEHIAAPILGIMIGDLKDRGKGVGEASARAAISWLFKQNKYATIYARYIIENEASKKLTARLGFVVSGGIYTDEDGITWQNVELSK